MKTAIGFAALIIVFGIFMPDVLHALEGFLLLLVGKATALIQTLPTTSPAMVSHSVLTH